MKKVTIESVDNDFCIYDKNGQLIEDNFDDYKTAKRWANENDYEIVETAYSAPKPIKNETHN